MYRVTFNALCETSSARIAKDIEAYHVESAEKDYVFTTAPV